VISSATLLQYPREIFFQISPLSIELSIAISTTSVLQYPTGLRFPISPLAIFFGVYWMPTA
jgi:hypothetical protein